MARCITTGWCNRPLEAIGFFRFLEAAITRLTGARPREDDERYGVAAAPAKAQATAPAEAQATAPAEAQATAPAEAQDG